MTSVATNYIFNTLSAKKKTVLTKELKSKDNFNYLFTPHFSSRSVFLNCLSRYTKLQLLKLQEDANKKMETPFIILK